MVDAAATADPFSAVADPERRTILSLLAGGELPVNAIAAALRLRQPLVSKHLRVLREAGLVRVRSVGQQRLYRLHPGGLRAIHDWIRPFAELWDERLDRLDEYLTKLQREERSDEHNP